MSQSHLERQPRARSWLTLVTAGYAAALLAAVAAGCSSSSSNAIHVVVHAEASLEEGHRWAAEDLASDLGTVLGTEIAVDSAPAPACRAGEVHIAVLGHGFADGETALAPLQEQAYTIEEERCGAGRRIVVRGGGLLSGQWAVYDLAHRLGVRYFHPEQTWYPTALAWPDEPFAVHERPAMPVRVEGVHASHPIEVNAPPDPGELDMTGIQSRWIDWCVKMRTTRVGGWDEPFVRDRAWRRGFERAERIDLARGRVNGVLVVDPEDPRPEAEQIAAAIDVTMAPRADAPPVVELGLNFNPSEFTELDDRVAVARLTAASEHLSATYPEVRQYATNHGTGGELTEHYGVLYYDLIQFAPPALGAKVHPLMFYGLDRPAPVYNNDSFEHKLDWIQHEAPARRIIWFPEAAWWLTFDMAVPLFLAPVTLEARQRDLELLGDLIEDDPDADHGVVGHRLFTTGHEWGYWMISWCVHRMTWDLSYTHDACLEDVTAIFDEGSLVRDVLKAVENRQAVDMRDPEILRYLVGSDDEAEVVANAGVRYHPLPPRPDEVLDWDDQRAAELRDYSLPALREMADDYASWAATLDTLVAAQDERSRPWLEEMRDGIRIFGLRAAHAVAVYQTLLDVRDAVRAGNNAAVDAAWAGAEEARGLTETAREVVRAREASYRYPDELTITGGERGTPDEQENGTIWPYRYLSRTHRMFYWTRPDDQVAELFADLGDEIARVERLVRVGRRVLLHDKPLEVDLLGETIEDLAVDWGDGNVETVLEPHVYASQGLLDWSVDATVDGVSIRYDDRVAVVARRILFPMGSLELVEPASATVIEGLLPGLVLGEGDDGTPFLAVGSPAGDGEVARRGSLQRRSRDGANSGPQDLPVKLDGLGFLTFRDATLTLAEGGGPEARTLDVSGRVSTMELVAVLAEGTGFTEEWATNVIAATLGYSPDELPPDIPFTLQATGREQE